MSRSILRGFGRRARSRPWVYIPCRPTYAQAIPDASTTSANVNWTITNDIAGTQGIPQNGSVRAVRVLLIARNSTVASTYLYATHHPDATGRPLGTVADGTEIGAPCGKVAGHYDQNIADPVMTGGKHNTQFKYSVAWASGTTTFYLRVLGYYVDADS